MSYQSEKNTEHIGSKYLCNLLNIDNYSTSGNRKLFQNKIPDGWILKDDNLLIIEYKSHSKDKQSGYKQLLNYCNLSKINNNLNIYCFLGIGTESQNFEKYFYKFTDNLQVTQESEIKKIFSNVKQTYSIQHIHDILVSNFHFDKAEELHDILTIVISSFISEDIVEYYTIKDKMVNKEFINLLINNARDILGTEYDKYLDSIQKTEFKHSFEVCKTIYNTYKSDPMSISKLFQQFKKYNSYSLSKNEIWTEPEIARIMFHELSKLINTSKSITISDPCVGGGNLIREFMKNCSNLTIKGCEINKRLSMNLKLDLIINGYNSDHIYNNDYFDIDVNLLNSDCSIVNPPYTKKISKHDCLEFVNRTLTHSKYCSYIIPKNKLFTERKELERLIENHSIISIIELGEIFKSVASTGDIIILTCSSVKTNDKTKYINMSNLADEHKKVIRSNEYKFTDKGNELLNSYYEDKINIIEYIPTVDQPYPEENLDMIVNIKNNIINDLTKTFKTNLKCKFLTKESKKDIEDIFRKRVYEIKNINSFNELIEILYDIKSDNIQKVRLMDYFELVKFKPTILKNTIEGNYPLYGASMDRKPIKMISEYNIDSNGEDYIQLNKNGSIGHCFIRNGQFSMNSHCFLLKQIQKLDLKINVQLMTLQIINMGFNYSNTINQTKLNNIELYLIL